MQKAFDQVAYALMPGLQELEQLGLANFSQDWITLTPRGLELSDVLGPWMGSPEVHKKMAAYQSK